MKSGFDINRIVGDGYLIIPLSMVKLAKGHGQSPEDVYEILKFFSKKLETFSNDVVFLYTMGTYYNSEDPAYRKRKKLNQQARQHSANLKNLIEKKKEFIPGAFHFLPVDYVILNSPNFTDYLAILQKSEQNDENFKKEIRKDIGDREYSEANVNFILEEIVVGHLVRQREVKFPRTLVQNDIWRLLVYPGPRLNSDKYQFENKVLSQNDKVNPYNNGQYNFLTKKYENYTDGD